MALPFPEMERIRRDSESCRACPLSLTAKTTVVYRGDRKPAVLFIGQSPGREEDEAGSPFVGRSGTELRRKIEERPFPPHGFTNAVLHHPPSDQYRPSYGYACRGFLERVVKAASPRVLVPLGRDAEFALSRVDVDLPSFSLRHPAAMLHNPSYRADWDSGWVKLRMWLASKGVH